MQMSAATAVSKSLRSFSCFTDFRGEGGSLALGLLQKVNSSTEKLFCVEKMTWNGLLDENLSTVGPKSAQRSLTVSLHWAASTAAANVTNASSKSSINLTH